MSKSHSEKFLSRSFDEFLKNPRGSTPPVIQGAKKFIQKVINKEIKKVPTTKVLTDLFNVFTKKDIKQYVFHRMGESIRLELALKLLQDLASNGAGRAKVLTLVVEKTAAGGKTVVIEDAPLGPQEEDNESPEDFLQEIDEAIFCFHDPSGSSPDVRFKSAVKRAAADAPDAGEDAFRTPPHRRSLRDEFDVRSRLLKS